MRDGGGGRLAAGRERQLLRSLPIYLAERCEISADWTSLTLIPVAQGKGYYFSTTPWPLDTLLAYLPADFPADVLVTGTFVGSGRERSLEMLVWSVTERKELARRAFPAGDNVALALETASWVEQLLQLHPLDGLIPRAELTDDYLAALGFLLSQLLVTTGALSPGSLWNEQAMYQDYFELADRFPDLLSCQLLPVAGCLAGAKYASPEAGTFFDAAREAVRKPGLEKLLPIVNAKLRR